MARDSKMMVCEDLTMLCAREGRAAFLPKAERLQKEGRLSLGLFAAELLDSMGWLDCASEEGSGSRDGSCSAFFEPGPFQWQIPPSKVTLGLICFSLGS